MKELRNIIAGAGTVLNIYPAPVYFRSRILINRNDYDALKGDWQKINEDLNRALGKYINEKPIEKKEKATK